MPALSRADTSLLGRWWWSVDRVTLLALSVLIGIGYVLALAATPGISMHLTDPHTLVMVKQIIFLGLGGVTMLGMSMLSLRQVKLAALGMGIVFFLLTGFTLVHGMEVDGAHRWISLPGFTIQPSEFLRPAFIIVSAWLIAESRRTPGFPGKRAAAGLFVLTALLLKMQPDIGMTFLFTMVVFAQFYLDGMEMKWVFAAIGLIIGALVLAFLFIAHVHSRVMLFWDPAKKRRLSGADGTFGFRQWRDDGPGAGRGPGEAFSAGRAGGFCLCRGGRGVRPVFLRFHHSGVRRHCHPGDDPAAERAEFVCDSRGRRADCRLRPASLRQHGVFTVADTTKGMTLPFISYGGSSVLAISMQMGFLLALTRKRHQGDLL